VLFEKETDALIGVQISLDFTFLLRMGHSGHNVYTPSIELPAALKSWAE